MWPWTTKSVIRVNFWKLNTSYHLKAEYIGFPLKLYLKIWNLRVQKHQNMIKKITFKVVQMKFLAMHIIDQKLRFYLFMVGNLQNIFRTWSLLNNDFWHKRKIDNFDPYNILLVIATNIPQRLMTGFDHKCCYFWLILIECVLDE